MAVDNTDSNKIQELLSITIRYNMIIINHNEKDLTEFKFKVFKQMDLIRKGVLYIQENAFVKGKKSQNCFFKRIP